MLSKSITAEQFNALPENVKGAYRTTAAGGYELALNAGLFVVDQDPVGLLNSKNHVDAENNQLKSKIAQLEQAERDRQSQLDTGDLIKKKDFEGLQTKFNEDLKTEREKFQAQLDQRDQQRALQVRKQKATELAMSIAPDAAHFLIPHLESQIAVKIENGQETLTITDAAGNPVLGDLNTLKQAVLDDPRNKAILPQSNASGGSSPNAQSGGSAVLPSRKQTDGSAKKYSDYSPGELHELKKSDPDAFEKLLSDHTANRGHVPLGAKQV